jgi:hypothetical protein
MRKGSSTGSTLEGYGRYRFMSDRLNRLFAVGCVTRKAQLAEIRGFLVLSLPALRLIGETLGTLPLSLRKQFLRFGAAGSISRFGEGGHCVTVCLDASFPMNCSDRAASA